jgi:hypothetical protein
MGRVYPRYRACCIAAQDTLATSVAFCDYPTFERVLPGVAAMKTVSMLIACVFALGVAGTARAADAHRHDSGAAGNGLLAAIGAVFSDNGDDTTTTPATHGGNHADNDDSAHGTLPDSASSTTAPASGDTGAAGAGTAPATPKRPTPSLGWQSLLPGSIQ